MAVSPYSPPATLGSDVPERALLEDLCSPNSAYRRHAQAIRSVAGLYLFSAGLYLVPVWRLAADRLEPTPDPVGVLDTLVSCLLSALFTGLFAAPLVVGVVAVAETAARELVGDATLAWLCAFLVVCAAGLAALAYAILRLRPWVRTPVLWLSVLGLAQFPVGTVIHAYVLFVFLGARTGTVLSEAFPRLSEASAGGPDRPRVS